MSWPDPIAGYLRRLDGAARDLPRAQRGELRGEIEGHLREALAQDDGEASLREALDRLEKLVGTLIVPGGLATAFYLGLLVGGETCGGGSAVKLHGPANGTLRPVARCTGATTVADHVLAGALLVFPLVAPVVTAIFLARRARPVAA